MSPRKCEACPEIVRADNQSGLCQSCRHYARLYRERMEYEKQSEIRTRVVSALRPAPCALCGRTGDRHDDGCPWKPKSRVFYSVRMVRKERNPITEYRCDSGHDFTSNLPHDQAICPYCHSRNIPHKGDSVQPPTIESAFLGIKRNPEPVSV